MKYRAFGLLLAAVACMPPSLRAQDENKSGEIARPADVIKTETRLVVVDAVVTDKKDKYVPDLAKKDFKVYEDGKEQQLKAFSFEADPNSPLNGQKHYLVLYFDNASMQLQDQQRAREAAEKFIDKNAGPNRLMAVVNFGGSLEIAQNFTEDADRLHQVVKGTKFSQLPTTASANGGARLPGGMAALGSRNSVVALRTLAKAMSDVPGRKILIYLTAGFPMNAELQTEVIATIDACNKANVAIYPLDVRGLSTGPGFDTNGGFGGRGRGGNLMLNQTKKPSIFSAFIDNFSSTYQSSSFSTAFFQRGGAGAGSSGSTGGGTSGGGAAGGGAGAGAAGGGSRGGGSTGGSVGGNSGGNSGSFGGSRGGVTGTNGVSGAAGRTGNGTAGGGGGSVPNPNQPFGQQRNGNPRNIVPVIPDFIGGNQSLLYMLANGTGGFPILNSNDLLGGLEKIAAEQNQYYILGYTPAESPEGSCHSLKVQVKSFNVRYRTGYCNVKSVDLLAGKPVERTLEGRIEASGGGTIPTKLQASYVYTAADTARVDVAFDIPADKLKFEKVKGKLHCDIDIVAIAYRGNGSVGARFSDTLKLEVEDKKQMETFLEKPVHYENQFDIASGDYSLKLAYTNGGEDFGKVTEPLNIAPYDTKNFGVSGIMLSTDVHKNTDQTGIAADLIEGRTPFTVGQMQLAPAGSNTFKKTEPVALYVEIYEPLANNELKVQIGAQMLVIDKNTGKVRVDSKMAEYTQYLKKPSTVAALGLKVPVAELGPGQYIIEIHAADNANKQAQAKAEFNVIE